jgi:tetratricopeptide (TPR) repeat protein
MKTNAATLAAGLLFFIAPSALAAGPADSASAIERARAVFHQGVQLYNEGSFEAALAEFRKAYQLSPNYRLLYNIAQTYFELHDYVSSSKTLKQYVQAGGSEISSARRAEVNELNQKLDDRIAYLDIACNVDGADIRVDEISVGVSPLAPAVPVNAGPRRITAVKAGYAVAAQMVTVVGGERSKVSFNIAALAQGESADLSAKGMPSSFLESEASPKGPSHTGLITSTIITGGLAIATGVFGLLALRAKSDFEGELGQIPNSKDSIDSARTKMKTYAYVTDGLGLATVASGVVSLVFLLTDSGSKKKSNAESSVALVPTVGGLLLHGAW